MYDISFFGLYPLFQASSPSVTAQIDRPKDIISQISKEITAKGMKRARTSSLGTMMGLRKVLSNS
jgi:hypothetical protein